MDSLPSIKPKSATVRGTKKHREPFRFTFARAGIYGSTIISCGLVLLIFAVLLIQSGPAIFEAGHTLAMTEWNPSKGVFGIIPMIFGQRPALNGSSALYAPPLKYWPVFLQSFTALLAWPTSRSGLPIFLTCKQDGLS